jgi:hypothetical protein
MRTLLGLALAAGVALFSYTAHAQSCMPQEIAVAKFAASDGYDSHKMLTGDPAQRAVAIYNAHPPQGDDAFDTVVLLVGKPGYGLVLLLGNDGLLCDRLNVPEDAREHFIRTVLGVEA